MSLYAQSTELMGWLLESALPLWWEKGADHTNGGFHEALDQDGEALVTNRRARVQTRQIYVYATAGKLGWRGPWREAVLHGLDFFLPYYLRADGLYRTVVAPDGSPVDDEAWLYDQAFALFAMAQAASVLPDRSAELTHLAHDLRSALERWRWPEKGFKEPPALFVHQSNPHMHLFEASLAWAEVDGNPVWNSLADEIAALALSKFIDSNGALHEFFNDGWALAPGINGRIVEPGHQFEWAWLLERWARHRSDEKASRAARRLFELGVSWGVCAQRCVATQQLLDDGSIHDDVARLWPQTERIKAAMIFDHRTEATRAVLGLNRYLDTPLRGLWWDKLWPDGSFVYEPAPASSLYHIVSAIAELQTTSTGEGGA